MVRKLEVEKGGIGGQIKSIYLEFLREEFIVAVTDRRCIYSAKIKFEDPKQDDKKKKSQLDYDMLHDNEDGVFKLLQDPGHSDKVVAADICVRKPYIATCSPDKSLRVWDFEQKRLIFLYNFPEPLVTVAFHPSGYHVAVGFSDKVQFINLYLGSKDQKRRDFREIPTKNCTSIKFSNGGGLIAIASGATSQVISIFKFYSTSMQVLFTLKGHIAMITTLEWSKDDVHLYSGGTHGLIFRWNLRTGQRFDLI